MSLATYSISSKSKASDHAPGKRSDHALGKRKADAVREPGIGARLPKMLSAFGRLCVNVFDAIAEARLQKAMIEAELYQKRYFHTSKNDDDLPIVR